MEEPAKKSEPKEFKDRNPHKSHLGEIACTVCHKQFEMKIPGAAKKQAGAPPGEPVPGKGDHPPSPSIFRTGAADGCFGSAR